MDSAVKSEKVVQVLVITGPVGVGKTSVARAISDLLGNAAVAHTMIDMDMLRWCYPSNPADPFHGQLGLQNLAAVWANYQAAGAQRVVMADVVETLTTVAQYEKAIPGAVVTVARLHAPVATLHARLAGRETGADLEWHQNRAIELAAQMEETALEDLRVDTEGKTVPEIAQEIIDRARWVE